MSNVSREDVRRWVREEILAIAEGLAAMQKAEARQVVAQVQTSQPKSQIPSLADLEWELMKATEKGPWEKSVTRNATYDAIVVAIKAKNGYPVDMDGFKVWLNDRDGSLGRRAK